MKVCAYSVRDVVGDVCEDVFGCVHAIQHLVHTQHVIDGFPLRQDRGHLELLLGLLHGNLCRLHTNKSIGMIGPWTQEVLAKRPNRLLATADVWKEGCLQQRD